MKTSQRIFWGLILIGTAVFLVLNQMGLITATVGIGTIAMGIICLAIMVSSIASRSFGGFFFSIGLAWLMFWRVLHLPGVSWTVVLTVVILLTIGFNILFPNKSCKHHAHNKWEAYGDEGQMGEHQQVCNEEKDGQVYLSNSFGATAKYIQTQDLRGADIKNSFGEMKVYFDGAVINNSPVIVHVENSFGELQLFVPNGWNVQHDVNVFAGEFQENNKTTGNGEPVVKIEGNVSFGEIQVTYV